MILKNKLCAQDMYIQKPWLFRNGKTWAILDQIMGFKNVKEDQQNYKAFLQELI